MKLGTHNSMSYLKPKKWYMYLFRFMAKCQRVDIEEQYKLGARMFDLRIHYNKDGVPEFKHGAMVFKGDVEETIRCLNSKRARTYVRLILEVKDNKDLARQETLFRRDCSIWYLRYRKIVFFCGRRKFDWKEVFNFGTPEPVINQLISSMTWKIYDDWYPWLYARIMNKKNLSTYNSKDWLLIDFIDIQ